MELSTQAALGVLFTYLMQGLKQSPLMPYISIESEKLNRWFNIVSAAALTFGIHFACSKVNHTCGFTLDYWAAWLGLKGLFLQWAIQHGWYQAVIKK